MDDVYSLGLAFSVGVCGGFVSSTPLGPINLWVARSVLEKREVRNLRAFLTGVIATDVVYAALGGYGYGSWVESSAVETALTLIGGLFLIGLGVYWLRPAAESSESTPCPPTYGTIAKNFSAGIFLCGFNPGFLVFWVTVFSFASKHFRVGLTGIPLFWALLGIVVGDLIWFGLLTAAVTKGRDAARASLLQRLRAAIAVAIIVLGSGILVHDVVLGLSTG